MDYDQIGSADPHPGELVVIGTLPTMNYHTTSAPTTNVNYDFIQDLDFRLEAQLVGGSVNDLGGGSFAITLDFASTNDGEWDLVLTDPDDSNAEILRGNLIAGVGGA